MELVTYPTTGLAVDDFVITSGVETVMLEINPVLIPALEQYVRTEDGGDDSVVDLPLRSGGFARALWRSLDGETRQFEMEYKRDVNGEEITRKRTWHGQLVDIRRVECLCSEVSAPPKDPARPELGRSRGYWITTLTDDERNTSSSPSSRYEVIYIQSSRTIHPLNEAEAQNPPQYCAHSKI
jgi:hypothetical protein